MDWEKELYDANEKPLDRLVDGYSHTSIFRKMAFIGDSLSSGELEYQADSKKYCYDRFEYSWGQYIARKNGLTAYNFSMGGLTTKDYIDGLIDDRGIWDKEKACQAYVIALGVNDVYGNNMPIGSIEDIDKDDPAKNKPTYIGCYAAIVAKYKEISPDAHFFFVTVPNTNTPERDEKTFGIINAIYALADYFDNCYVIDLYKYAPVYDDRFKEHFYLNGHMSPAGYLFTARLIDSYIDYIIRHNPDAFRNTGFIGLDMDKYDFCV